MNPENIINEPFFGFQKESLDFLKKLKKPRNNNKEWFEKNRNIYEAYIKYPMRLLIDELSFEMNKLDSSIICNYKSIFRINRDLRFTKDKKPYKTQTAASFCFDVIKKAELPQFYFHISPDEFLIAGGQYSEDSSIIKKIRNHIVSNFPEYKSIITSPDFIKAYKKVEGNKLKKLPKGFENIPNLSNDKLLIEALKMKQYYVFKAYNPVVSFEPELINIITENFKLMYNFVKFLNLSLKN